MVSFVKNLISSALNVKIFPFILLFLAYIILYKIYLPRISAFGCFDDCFNYVAGYFILKGKILYLDIPFNHQPLMAYISYLIQLISSPINIYELILRHRQFIFLFGFLMNVLIVWRFKWIGIGFVFLYEFNKFYIFGDRFLAEGIIVYPLVYMAGLIWYKFQKKEIYAFEYILAAIFTWFVIFMREPYVPLSLLTYGLLLFGKSNSKIKIISLLSFFALVFLILIFIPIKEYIFNIFSVNDGLIKRGLLWQSLLKSFYYPVYIFFGGKWNLLRYYFLGLNLIFLILFFYFLRIKKHIKLCVITLLILGFANFRANTIPGTIYFEAFNMNSWLALLIFFLLLMLKELYLQNKKMGLFMLILLFLLFLKILSFPQSYINDKIDRHTDFITNFGNYLQVGEVVRKLSDPKDTLFLDGFDDLIYWQADRSSSYKYAWYSGFMVGIPKYDKVREEMFKTNPPDFYYGSCPKETRSSRLIPKDAAKNYVRLYSLEKPTCLFVKKEKLAKISKAQWQKAKEFLYDQPHYSLR